MPVESIEWSTSHEHWPGIPVAYDLSWWDAGTWMISAYSETGFFATVDPLKLLRNSCRLPFLDFVQLQWARCLHLRPCFLLVEQRHLSRKPSASFPTWTTVWCYDIYLWFIFLPFQEWGNWTPSDHCNWTEYRKFPSKVKCRRLAGALLEQTVSLNCSLCLFICIKNQHCSAFMEAVFEGLAWMLTVSGKVN